MKKKKTNKKAPFGTISHDAKARELAWGLWLISEYMIDAGLGGYTHQELADVLLAYHNKNQP